MSNIVREFIRKQKTIFEYSGDDSVRRTFKDELNYEAGKLFFTMLISLVAWLPYIQNDIVLHQYPALAVAIRIGLSTVSLCLIVLKYIKRFRNRPDIMMMIMIGYLNFATALVVGSAGAFASSYIGGFCLVLMIITFSPFTLNVKFMYSILSFALFFAIGALTNLDFQEISVQYAINDLISSFILSIFVSYILNDIKYRSWKRRQKLKEMVEKDEKYIEEIMSLAERAEIASRAKINFLARMSHEIRTPMNAITGMAELAMREEMSVSAQEHILTIKQASANLLSIINDILDISKIESGNLEIVPSNYLLSSLVNDVISIIRMRVVDSRLRFVVNIDCGIPNALFGNETRIRQVMLNILSNAVKYTKNGFISFAINGDVADDNTVFLTIDVADSGIGIKEEDLGKLFGDFVQLDLASNKGVEGTGLGLAITKSLISAMDGDISVYSEYGKGSTFTITLPQKIRSPEPLAIVENPEEKHVLVYEQCEIYADSMVCTIDNLGVSCTRVTSDEELREKLKIKDYSHIFVVFYLLENAKKVLSEAGSKARIVLLTEFGNVVANKDLSILAMPVHSISVAKILNGESDTFSYSAENSMVRFNAPKARILIVDDINTNLKVAEGLLLPYKMQVDLCLSGAEAIEAVKANNYDIIFMDHMMPEMDGIEATKLIRELNVPHSKSLTIIALTANAVSGTREMFLSNGMNDFLSKPIDTVKLNAILETWIPKEKQEKLKGELGKIVPKDSKINLKIEGIDVNKGIAMTGGTPELYMQTLAVFHKDGIKKIEEIKKCLETDNYPLYTTHVHALKSAFANIGANELSETAKVLEVAGKQEDLVYIKQRNTRFLMALELLLSNISAFLPAYSADSETEQKVFIDFEILKNELCKLKEALDILDSEIIDKAASALQKFVKANEIGANVENILQNILIGEYDEAESMINNLLEEIN